MRPDTIHDAGHLVPGANRSGYIPVLDGWRAVAISLVLVYHALLNADLTGHSAALRVEGVLDHLGPFGVLVFFMISGYLITSRLIADHKKTGRFNLREFYYKRAFRILPLSYIYLLAMAVLALLQIIQMRRPDWSSALFVANYVGGRSWYTGHFWSLSVEEHFYLIWPPIIALAGWRRSCWIGIGLIVAVAVWRPWELDHTLPGLRFGALERTDMRLDFLMVGSVMAIALAEWPSLLRWFQRMGTPAGCVAISGALWLTLAPFPFDTRTIQALLLGGLICGTATSQSPLIQRLLANRPALFLGQISYSLYILQQPFFRHSSLALLNNPAIEFCKLVPLVGLSWLSYNFVEKPFVRYSRKRIREKETAASEAIMTSGISQELIR